MDEGVGRLFEQVAAFNEVTVECDRCHTEAALDLLSPTARGFHCRRCLIEMPTSDFRALEAEGDALETSLRR